MKKYFYLLLISILIISGCNGTEVKEDNIKDGDDEMNEYDIFDFSFINMAPEAEKKQPLNKVIKLYFSVGSIAENIEVAVDLGNGEIYKNPVLSTLGVDTFEDPVKAEDLNEIIAILEKYNVQDWKKDYTFENPNSYLDGYSWSLMLQYEDGTVEKHRGQGTKKGKITPENFDGFLMELKKFVDERLGS